MSVDVCAGAGRPPVIVTKVWAHITGIDRPCAGTPRRGLCITCGYEFQVVEGGGVRVHKARG